jgi:DNA-directed RNA polymerase sigma subunit (sigma70/sigma32)
LHFGLFGHEAQTHQEIGLNARNLDSGKIGITQQRIRQIEAKALRKLRHQARRHFFE